MWLGVLVFVVLLLSGLCTGYLLSGVWHVVDSLRAYRDNANVSYVWSNK